MAKVKIVNADVIEWAKNYRGEKFHALFADVPYSLGDGKKGFMNKEWDNNIAMQADTWAALAEHLLPGAFLFVFAGTLNDDLISVAMRQAGLRKFHKAINWGFGSGFPKASRIDTAIDRAAGARRKVIGTFKITGQALGKNKGLGLVDTEHKREWPIEQPAAPLAKTWAGHRYGLQALKPAAETILIFCKPFEKGKKPVDSIVKNGAGALNVDATRIKTEENTKRIIKVPRFSGSHYANGLKYDPCDENGRWESGGNSLGRWPANLMLQHSQNDNGTCSPSCPCRELDEQSGERPNSFRKNDSYGKPENAAFKGIGNRGAITHNDTGGASRFFFNADWNHEAAEQISSAAAVRYVAKASRRERDAMSNEFVKLRNDLSKKQKNKIINELNQLGIKPISSSATV